TTFDGAQPYYIYIGSFLFGAFALPLYSLSVAHANDHAERHQYVLVAAGLIFFYAIGACIGPFVASLVIDRFGAPAFFTYTGIVHGGLVIATLIRMVKRPQMPEKTRARFASALRTSPVLFRFAIRNGKRD
ncbi:MAG: MFS transporter, partial [Hyphomicrobiales bacterium]|nr:MFS transporter [Hyphomicrobiales bacterium]